jgi:3-phosphoshikimate 1-carboxyvinyltransferase
MGRGALSDAAPRPLTARRSQPLKGTLRVPGDKSISHRALIFGALAVGQTAIAGLLEGDDVLHTADAMRALGAKVERTGPGGWSVHGVGVSGFRQPADVLDFGNSGTGCRLVMGAVAGCPVTATFDGDASLRKRPMRRILEPLELIGARPVEVTDSGRLPLKLMGARDPIPVICRTPVPSAQIKSAVLLAGLAAPGETIVIESEASRDHTERLLAHFGADVRSEAEGQGCKITLRGQPELVPAPIVVPADPSSAAFPLVAALLVPGSELILKDVMTNPLRTGLITTLQEMGADIEILDRRSEGGEELADLRVRSSQLRGVEVPAGRAPTMIDEYPILAVAASFAKSTTVMRGLGELRVKESDRLAAIADGLRVNGIEAEIAGDDLFVRGSEQPVGGREVATHMDHRIAMAFLIMGLATKNPVRVDDSSFIATSFPGFVEQMAGLGAEFA